MFDNNSIITVSEGQYLALRSCTAYPIDEAPDPPVVDGYLLSGMYRVGVDIAPGEYRLTALEDSLVGGVIEVTKDSLHLFDSIITIKDFENDTYITLSDGQYLKMQNCVLRLN